MEQETLANEHHFSPCAGETSDGFHRVLLMVSGSPIEARRLCAARTQPSLHFQQCMGQRLVCTRHRQPQAMVVQVPRARGCKLVAVHGMK